MTTIKIIRCLYQISFIGHFKNYLNGIGHLSTTKEESISEKEKLTLMTRILYSTFVIVTVS